MLKNVSSKPRGSSQMKGPKESKMDSRSLEKRFSSVKETAEEIQGLARWCLQHRNHQHSILQAWSKALRKSKVPHRLTLFYVCNEIVQNARRKKLLDVNQHFATVIKEAIPLVRDEKVRQKIVRIFNIWEERGIYDSKFIAELTEIMENVGTVNASENEVVLAGFQPIQLVEGMRAITELEKSSVSLANDLKNQHFTLTDEEIAQLRQTVKERGTSRERMEEFEEAVVALECYIASVQKEVEQRTAVITLLEQAEIFYEGLRGEAKQVAGAYKNFGNRVRILKGKLVEKIKTLPEDEASPVPSPVADAPSPDNSDVDELSIPQAGVSGIGSFMDGGSVAELAASAIKSGYGDLESRLSSFTNASDSPEIISASPPKSSTGAKPYTPNTSFTNDSFANASFISDAWDTPERSRDDRYEPEKSYEKVRDRDQKSKEKSCEEDSWEKSVASNFLDIGVRSNDRDHDSSRDRDREASRDRDKDRERERDRSNYREYEPSSRDRERGNSRDVYIRDRETSREPERGESWERGSSRDRDRSSSRDYGNAALVSRQTRESRNSRDGDRDYRVGWDQESRDFLSQKSRDYSQTPTHSSYSSPANSLKDANLKESKSVSIGMGAAELLNTFGKSMGSSSGTSGSSNTVPSSTAASHTSGHPQVDLTRPPPNLSIPLPPPVPTPSPGPGIPYTNAPPPPIGPPPVPVPPPVPPPPVGPPPIGPPPVGPPPVPVPPPGPPPPYDKPPGPPPFPPKSAFPPPKDEQPPFPPYLPPNLGSNWGPPPPPPPPPNEDNEEDKEDGWPRDYSSAWSDYDQYNNSQDVNEAGDDDDDNRNWGEPPGTEELEALNSETPSSPPHYEQGFKANLAPPPLPPVFFQGPRSNLRELVTITDGGDTDHRSTFPQHSSNSDSDYRCYDYRSLSEASSMSNSKTVPSIKTLFSQDDDQDLRVKKSSSTQNHDSGSDMDISGSASESENDDMEISDGDAEHEPSRSKEKRKRVSRAEPATKTDRLANTGSDDSLRKTEENVLNNIKDQNSPLQMVAKDIVKPKTIDDAFDYDDIFVIGEGKGQTQDDGSEDEESPRKKLKSEYEISDTNNKDLNGQGQDVDFRSQMGHEVSQAGRGWYKDFSNTGERPPGGVGPHNNIEQDPSSPGQQYTTEDSDMRTQMDLNSDSQSETNSPEPVHPIESLGGSNDGRPFRTPDTSALISVFKDMDKDELREFENMGERNDPKPFRTPDTSALISVFKDMDKEELKRVLESTSLSNKSSSSSYENNESSCVREIETSGTIEVLNSSNNDPERSGSMEPFEHSSNQDEERGGMIEVLSGSAGNDGWRSRGGGGHFDQRGGHRGSWGSNDNFQHHNRDNFYSPRGRGRGGLGPHGTGPEGIHDTDDYQITEPDNNQVNSEEQFQSWGRGRGDFNPARGRGDFSGRGRGDFNGHGRGDFNSPRGRGDFNARGRGDLNNRGRGLFYDFNSSRGRGEFTPPNRGRGDFSSPNRGRGDFSSSNRGRGFPPSPQTDFNSRGGGNFRGNFRGGDRGRGFRGGMRGNAWW